jgi:hypothetical protein
VLQEELAAAHQRIEEMEKQMASPPAFGKAIVKNRRLFPAARRGVAGVARQI